MSGIFGIFYRDGKSVEAKTVNAMLKAMSYWEPDDKGVWIDGPVALGHTMLWNTPESKYEKFPLQNDAYVLTMDARIDNRDELAKEIELPDRPLSEIGDSEFILASYKKWGEECPKYLLGDFAFAIWDTCKQQFFCARDQIGVRPFYYHLDKNIFLFGNDLKGLTRYPDISKEINDESIANYIVNKELIRSNEHTFFKAFKKLLPAHSLIITNRKIKEKCYWKLKDAPKVKLSNTEAYAKKLRELLENAVDARMRSDYPITSHLSGGLDSSSIAVLAARKLKQKGEKLLAFNWLHEPGEDDDLEQNEWSNSKIIAETEGIEHHYVSLTAEDIYSYMSEEDIAYGETSRFWYEYIVREAAQKRSSRTMLSGWGGDDIATYHGQSFYSDLFIHRKFITLFKELKARVKNRRSMKNILSVVYHSLIIPLVPRSLYCKMPKIICDESDFFHIKKEFMEMIEKENNKSHSLTMQPPKTIRQHMLTDWEYGHIQSRIESWETASIVNKLEYSYPLLDKRLIEFMLGIPGNFFVYNGVGRFVFRSAVRDLLPKKILYENVKSEPNRVSRLVLLTLSALKRCIAEKMIDTSHPINYIDMEKVIKLLSKIESESFLDTNYLKLYIDIENACYLANSKKINQRIIKNGSKYGQENVE